MRRLLFAAALVWAALWLADGAPASAWQQGDGANQQVPDAPQPQKPAKDRSSSKSASPGADSSSGAQPSSSQHPSDAKPDASGQQPSAGQENPFPEDVSRSAASSGENPPDKTPPDKKPADGATGSPKGSAGDANPFPEDVSRKAAQAAGDGSAESSPAKSEAPADSSSSQDSGLTGGLHLDPIGKSTDQAAPLDPPRSKQDTQVGDFYLGQGNWQGAYLRYQDAIKSDPGNLNAVFGMAEAARQLGKFNEATRNYAMYLAVSPDGPKAKRALKALKEMPSKR
ncbi:MAG TPA: tetratricopeptide repeat protein [Acidobacteriaceae bacterium]|nr:tetratricopeptide repeat protein [Acidobacteriaceae bacterium]